MRSATVVAVVLTHNGREQAIVCLRSLVETNWPSLRLVLVDNASTDGAADAIEREFDAVEVVRSMENRGYAGGNNLGVERALDGPCDFVFLVNDDTVVAKDAIEQLVDAMAEGVGAAAPLITYETMPESVWYAGARYDPRRGHPGGMEHYRRSVSEVGARGETDRFAGAAVLLPRTVLEYVGGFDERLHFLYEDVDLSLRIRAAGLQILFVPEAVVRHKVAMTQDGEHSPSSFYYGIRNQLVVADRYAPRSLAGSTFRTFVALGVHVARLRHADRRWASATALVAGYRDHRRRCLGAWIR